MPNTPLPKPRYQQPVYGFERNALGKSAQFLPKIGKAPASSSTRRDAVSLLPKPRYKQPVYGFEKDSLKRASRFAPNSNTKFSSVQAAIAAGTSDMVKSTTVQNSKQSSGLDTGKIQSRVKDIVPYTSNIVNSLRKPPAPIKGKPLKAVGLHGVSLDAERNEIDRGTRAADIAAENIGGQTGAAIQGANKAQNFVAKGQSYARETGFNTQTRNQQAQINASIDAQNAAREDQYNQDVLGYKMAYQREQSQNLANLSDKRIADINRKDAIALEERKFNVLSKAYTNGIVDRLARKVLDKSDDYDLTDDDRKAAIGLSTKKLGGPLRKVLAMGGPTDPPVEGNKPAVAVYKTQAEVDAANQFARDFLKRRNLTGSVNENAYVAKKPGDPVVPIRGTGTPNKKLAFSVPSHINREDIKGDSETGYYYEDNNGNIVDVSGTVLTQPRFRPTNATASLAMGGKLGGGGEISKKSYNPNLAAGDKGFQDWYKKNTLEGKRGIAYDDKQLYDYYSFYRNGDYKDKSFNIEAHFPDTYKRPGHPTFSDESIYAVKGTNPGRWEGETYIPYDPFKLGPKATAKHAMGGKLGRMRGRIRKVY